MDTLTTILPGFVLAVAVVLFIFWPQQRIARQVEKTRLDYLRERRDAIYENLRDLNFEYKAGKYPESDFNAQRDALEHEAATVLNEIDSLTPSPR